MRSDLATSPLVRPLLVTLIVLALVLSNSITADPSAASSDATITLSSGEGIAGDVVTVKGEGFSKSELGVVVFGATAVTGFRANGVGRFVLRASVPDGESGIVEVVAHGSQHVAASEFLIRAPAPEPAPEPTPPADSGDDADDGAEPTDPGDLAPVDTTEPVDTAEPDGDPAPEDGADATPGAMPEVALTWAPPAGWEQYEEFVLPARGGTVELDSDVDYRIVAPDVRTEALHIRGGRNIVWIGGHIHIQDRPGFTSATSRRGLVVSDATDGSSVDGRVIHVEGLLVDGDDLSEGINTNAPSAVFQLQNIRVEAVHLRGADDRDGTGGYASRSHPDILQVWGSKQELRVDGLTGRSNYQGIFLNEDTASSRFGPNYFRRVDLEMVERAGEDGHHYAGHRGYSWTSTKSGRQFLDDGTVWIDHHVNSGWTAAGPFRRVAYRDPSGVLVSEPVLGTSTFADSVHPAARNGAPYGLQLGSDEIGSFGWWSDDATVDVAPDVPAVRNFLDTAPGRIYAGAPPEGDYVPRDLVGREYVSPGYR